MGGAIVAHGTWGCLGAPIGYAPGGQLVVHSDELTVEQLDTGLHRSDGRVSLSGGPERARLVTRGRPWVWLAVQVVVQGDKRWLVDRGDALMGAATGAWID